MNARTERILENLLKSLTRLDLQFRNVGDAISEHAGRPPGKAIRDFREDHLPFLLAYPLVVAASPSTWLKWHSAHAFPSVRSVLLPPLFVIALLFLSAFFDKLLEFRHGPLRMRDRPAVRNVTLFLTMPVSAALIFFLIHPLAGWLMLFSAAAFSLFQAAHYESTLRRGSMRSVVAEIIVAAGFLLLPLVGLLLLYNAVLTARILADLF